MAVLVTADVQGQTQEGFDAILTALEAALKQAHGLILGKEVGEAVGEAVDNLLGGDRETPEEGGGENAGNGNWVVWSMHLFELVQQAQTAVQFA